MNKLCYLILSILMVFSTSCKNSKDSEMEELRRIEKTRLKSLVDAEMEVAETLHAEGFQLVNPSGRTFTKEQYLSGIKSGNLDYKVFEPESEIQVRIDAKSAVLRYKSTIEITVGNQHYPPERFLAHGHIRISRWKMASCVVLRQLQ